MMIAFGVGIIYYEYFLFQRAEGLLLGGLFVLWAFVRIWAFRQFVERRMR